MPQLERLDWIAPLGEGRGVTLTDDPEADMFLAQCSDALLFGVLYDSQYATRRAFAIPLRLKERLGHFNVRRLADDDSSPLVAAFSAKPALHRFPYKYATLTQQLAKVLAERYGGSASQVWENSGSVSELANRLLALPGFGIEKTDWTVGMLGRLGVLGYGDWDGFRAKPPKKRAIGRELSHAARSPSSSPPPPAGSPTTSTDTSAE